MARSSTDTEPVHIECGISGNAQESDFMNATLQSHNDLEFSIHTLVSVPAHITEEADLSRYLYWVLGTMVDAVPSTPFWGGPKVEFDVELGPAGDGEEEAKPCISWAFIGGIEEMDFDDFALKIIQDEGAACEIAKSLLDFPDGYPYEWDRGEQFKVINRGALKEQLAEYIDD